MEKEMSREFPELVKKLHSIEIDYADGDGIDFEPYQKFYTENETADWIKAWTGNAELNGSEYLIFGQDGTGGYAAFWCVRETSDLLKQPIVFFGSEGELGVVARDFYDYLWLFAFGLGPYEAVAYPGMEETENHQFLEFAEKHAVVNRKSAANVIALAVKEFPKFKDDFYALCR